MSKSFSPHLSLAHSYWRKILKPNDTVIDMTCGNGHDTKILCEFVPDGSVYGFDVQQTAIAATEKITSFHPNVKLIHDSHDTIDKLGIKPRLIIYNLGYLPGSDKSIKTEANSTLSSLQKGMEMLEADGAISIMCYPGHQEGEIEEKALLEFLETLSSQAWRVCYHKWINRPLSPTLLWIERLVKR